jgi:autoinducer 2-degrading protein
LELNPNAESDACSIEGEFLESGGTQTMNVTLVHVHVKPESVANFIEATRENHQASIREKGNRRFDVLQLASDPARFVLYEAYASADDAAAHKQTAHYQKWRDAVAGWMASPRQGVQYDGLFPSEPANSRG